MEEWKKRKEKLKKKKGKKKEKRCIRSIDMQSRILMLIILTAFR